MTSEINNGKGWRTPLTASSAYLWVGQILFLRVSVNIYFQASENDFRRQCLVNEEKALFWSSYHQNVAANGDHDAPNDILMMKEAAGIEAAPKYEDETDHCAYMIGSSVRASNCDSWYPCGLCQLPQEQKKIFLKGK